MSTFLIAAILAVSPASQGAEDPTALADRLLTKGEELFNARDAAGLAATYADDARIELFLRQQSGGWDVKSYEGAEEIRSNYANLFNNEGSINARNVVEYARLVGDDLLVIAGTFEPDLASGLLIQFEQLRVRDRDGRWLIRRLQLVPIPR